MEILRKKRRQGLDVTSLSEVITFKHWLAAALMQLYDAMTAEERKAVEEHIYRSFILIYRGLSAEHVFICNAISSGCSGLITPAFQDYRNSGRHLLSFWCLLSAVTLLQYRTKNVTVAEQQRCRYIPLQE